MSAQYVAVDPALINELLSLEAWATGTAERAARLRKKLQPVSTGSSKNKSALTPAQVANILAKKNKRISKQQ